MNKSSVIKHISNTNVTSAKSPKSSSKKINQVNKELNNNLATSIESHEDKMNSYKTPVNKVMEYGSNMINSYKAPVDKALESGSNSLSSGITSITNKVTKFPVIEQYMPWLSEEDQ